MPPFAPFPLTPSELVYLHGEQYAKKHLVNNVKLMHADLSVSAGELVHAMLMTAFLASEAEGVLQLVIGKKKTLLGSRDELFAEPGPAAATWPAPSIESNLLESGRGLKPRSANTVTALVYNLLDADCASPGAAIIDLCKPYLAQRRLMNQGQKKVLGFIPTTTYDLPASTIAGAAQFPMARINQMLATAQQTRPELWKLLLGGVKDGISKRVEQVDTDD